MMFMECSSMNYMQQQDTEDADDNTDNMDAGSMTGMVRLDGRNQLVSHLHLSTYQPRICISFPPCMLRILVQTISFSPAGRLLSDLRHRRRGHCLRLVAVAGGS